MSLPFIDWQTSKKKLTERGKYLLETGLWSDCKFIVGQEPEQEIFKGHKLFLAMSSRVFEKMFFGSTAEKDDPIPISDVQPKTFKVLLEFIYTEKAELTNFELARDLYYCANTYMLPDLMMKCIEYLSSIFSPNDMCMVYKLATSFEKKKLMKYCLGVICGLASKVLNETSWKDIKLETLLTVLDQEKLKIDSEIELFIAVEKWAKSECCRKGLDPASREDLRSVIGDAFTKIRFLSLTAEEFATGPAMSPMLSRDEAHTILMNICNNTLVSLPEGFCTLKVKREKVHSYY